MLFLPCLVAEKVYETQNSETWYSLIEMSDFHFRENQTG